MAILPDKISLGCRVINFEIISDKTKAAIKMINGSIFIFCLSL
jgi:hypothetical protein